MPLTLFTFGYWGWGNATRQLVDAADAVEQSRGFAPPLFVDVRFSRAVRAVGFQGHAFGRVLGDGRYFWMRGLGNEAIGGEDRARIRIHDPSAAAQLLDLALAAQERNARVLFYCSCEFPGVGQATCHRRTVAELVRTESERRRIHLTLDEWPGGAPRRVDLTLAADEARRAFRGARSVVVGPALPLAEAAALPWGSIIRLSDGPRVAHLAVGPARYDSRGYYLPVVPGTALAMGDEPGELMAEVSSWRRQHGLDP